MPPANHENPPHPTEPTSELSLPPVPEELTEEYFLVGELEEFIANGEREHKLQPPASELARAALLPFQAYSFIRDKVKRKSEQYPELRSLPRIQRQTTESAIVRYNKEFSQLGPLDAEQLQEQATYLSDYSDYALKHRAYPEIFVASMLLKHAEGLNRPDVMQAARVLLAVSGRAIDIIEKSGLGSINGYDTV